MRLAPDFGQLGDADVVIVGAGPAGAAAAAYLAEAGIDVLLLDKATFPRDKVCGDGLTPRAVRELDLLDVPRDSTWLPIYGLRVIATAHRLELPWPRGGTYPDHGLTKPRADFDAALLAHARAAGARIVQGVTVTAPLLSPSGRVIGVRLHPTTDDAAPNPPTTSPLPASPQSAAPSMSGSLDDVAPHHPPTPSPLPVSPQPAAPSPAGAAAPLAGPTAASPAAGGPGPGGPPRGSAGAARGDAAGWAVRARVVVGADGAASRLALAVGRRQRTDRPIGVAARTYVAAPERREPVAYMESHLELWDGPPGESNLLPGYGWIFPLADGRLNLGLGTVRSGRPNANPRTTTHPRPAPSPHQTHLPTTPTSPSE
ncbi:MAG: FAD-dependent oxidoreductase, partial [Bifidobacteriaceae bacterium]|nr:FAD-dependent oxidoreductase [Bifidobacteriaceae bacterium]